MGVVCLLLDVCCVSMSLHVHVSVHCCISTFGVYVNACVLCTFVPMCGCFIESLYPRLLAKCVCLYMCVIRGLSSY
jgi:hypothetical protein